MGSGLEGVTVAETALVDIDGERGQLLIAGYPVEELAERCSFEDACALLWDGDLPDADRSTGLREELGRARVRAFAKLGRLGDALRAPTGIEALRAGLSHGWDMDGDPVAIVGAAAVIAAAWAVSRGGGAPVDPDPAAGHAADYLRMATGKDAAPARAAALDAYLVTVAEHGLNASTFAARIVASTASDDVSAVVAAIGALKGPLHGGAPGPVLEMLEAIGTPERARPWLEAELAAGRRIMGMGHRVYRTRDPRVAVLEGAIRTLGEAGVATERLALAGAAEREARALLRERHPDRPLEANVEFATAVLLDAVGLPAELFTATFAVSRVAGWLAHTQEQRAGGRLIRPTSTYVGPRR